MNMDAKSLTLHFHTTLKAAPEVEDLGWLWVLRLYATRVADFDGEDYESIPRHMLGVLAKYADEAKDGTVEATAQDFLALIGKELKAYERKRPKLAESLQKNLMLLVRRFGLNAIERDILTFRIVYFLHQGLELTLDNGVAKKWMDITLYKVLAVALKRKESEIVQALSPEGGLCGSGLLEVSPGFCSGFDRKLWIFHGILCGVIRPASSVEDMLKDMVSKAKPSTLTCGDFPHHADEIRLIGNHLTNASRQDLKGVNILFHGEPGVGKTELARALASELKMNAYEVSVGEGTASEEEENQNIRFHAYQFLEKLLSKVPNGLVIFDEIEDVLPRPALLGKRSKSNKAWINQLLESNPVPAIWIANHVWQIDPAYMRRFDIVLEVRTPPRSRRLELMKQAFGELPVDAHWLERRAGEADLSPAVAHRTLRVIRNAGVDDIHEVQACFDRQMDERRNALDITNTGVYPEPRQYRLDLLNTSTDMDALCRGVARSGRGRVLLYGPPGCGKTAFAHHLARTMDRPLMLKRASDVISMWIGETEKSLRDMFREAARDNAVLLLDEADSFLQDRRQAQRSWELTQVNELLTQMENFNGVFVCATNFMEHLDAAAMRRFAFKVKFEFLTTEQALSLFQETLSSLGSWPPDATSMFMVRNTLDKMGNLTPGDFAAVMDQFRLLDVSSGLAEMLAELDQASQLKGDGNRVRMGFAA
jgi:SpoVK/Ycf46/Vps4 family AAA+-type ATPase